jgi:recombinational DNA repair ATPase RecF
MGNTQTLVTTTELDIFTREFLDHAALWYVEEGQLSIKH